MRAKPAKDANGIEYRSFTCPGCDERHVIPVTGPKAWGFNGNDERPTFTPSILVQGKYAGGEYGPPNETRCHSFVTDGRIQYLSDCTHALAGMTVDLPEMPA